MVFLNIFFFLIERGNASLTSHRHTKETQHRFSFFFSKKATFFWGIFIKKCVCMHVCLCSFTLVNRLLVSHADNCSSFSICIFRFLHRSYSWKKLVLSRFTNTATVNVTFYTDFIYYWYFSTEVQSEVGDFKVVIYPRFFFLNSNILLTTHEIRCNHIVRLISNLFWYDIV